MLALQVAARWQLKETILGLDIEKWGEWLQTRAHIAGKLEGADSSDLEAYFLKTHAASEALFRRLIFIGLRRNGITYNEASDWLHHNDTTPALGSYDVQFDRLYGPALTFQGMLSGSRRLNDLWALWTDFSKIIRNHLTHGMRRYSDAWLTCGVRIDQGLMVELDAAIASYIGGSPAGNLRLLGPRLPLGTAGANIHNLLGKKRGQVKPKASLQSAQARLKPLGLWP